MIENRQHLGRTAARHSPSVLIADDDQFCVGLLERAFGRLGFATVSHSSGRDAWAAISDDSCPSIAVVNWLLPDLDGHVILRRIQEQQLAVIPVLMIGRYCLHDAWARLGLRTGYVLTKPFQHTMIDQQVRQVALLASCQRSGFLRPERGSQTADWGNET